MKIFVICVFIFFSFMCAQADEYANLDRPVMADVNDLGTYDNNLGKITVDYGQMMENLKIKIFPHTDDRAPHRKDTVLFYLKLQSTSIMSLSHQNQVLCQSKIIQFNQVDKRNNKILCVDENKTLPLIALDSPTNFDYSINTTSLAPIQVIRAKHSNNYFYWGSLLLKKETDRLILVNNVNMEDYIAGVIPGEIYVSWPSETVSTQAVAARSYALYHLAGISNNYRLYHFDDTTSYQVYIGDILQYKKYQLATGVQLADADRINILEMINQLPEFFAAIARTKREVMVQANNKVFQAYFHASSGGYTASAQDLEFKDCLPCQEVLDYCEDDIWGDEFAKANLAPLDFWKVTRSKAEVESRLKKAKLIGMTNKLDTLLLPEDGYNGPPYRTIGGHYTMVPMKISKDVQNSAGYPFKSAMGLSNIRYEIYKQDNNYIFEGRGYGHSVGMSQWGAYFQGKKIIHYHDILKYYYKDIQIKRF